MAFSMPSHDGSLASSDRERLELLGVNKSLNDIPKTPLHHNPNGTFTRARCPNAIVDWGGRPLTLREKAMMRLMGELMEKPDWERKVYEEDIVAKWQSEAVGDECDFSKPMFDYVSL